MITVDLLAPSGWQTISTVETITEATSLASTLCANEKNTYRIMRSKIILCLVRPSGISWINAETELIGNSLNKHKEKKQDSLKAQIENSTKSFSTPTKLKILQ